VRWLFCACLAATSSIAASQVYVSTTLNRAYEKMREAGLLKGVPQGNPVTPEGFPPLAPKTEPLPDSNVGLQKDERIHVLRLPFFQRSGNVITGWGGVRVQYQGWDIFAQKIIMDLDANVFEAEGDVQIFGEEAVITGERVIVNFDNDSYQAFNAESQIDPTILKGEFRDALYVRAKSSHGTERELFGTDTIVTTCNYPEPHYHIDADRTTIRPGVRAILRDVKLVILGKTILNLPYLSIPLNEPSYRYLPEFGQNEQDGYFVKARYGIPLKDQNDFLDARLDYFEKRGLALGGDWNYAGAAATGLLSLYALSGLDKTFNLTNRHQQKFGFGTLTLDNSYQQNNFLTAPESTLLSTRATLDLPQRAGTTRIGLTRTENDSVSFENLLQTISLNDNRRYGPNTNSRLDLNWTENKSTFTEREQVDVKAEATHDLKKAQAKFEYQRSIPVGDIQNFFSSNDRTPVFSLISDSRRLFGEKTPLGIPFQTELSVGEYVDSFSRERITRSAFDLQFNKPQGSADKLKLGYSGRFKQGLYSDDTAQYILALNSQLSYTLGERQAVNLRYNYLRPYGFTPLQIDRSGETNTLALDATYRPIRPVLLGLQSGYDMLASDLGRDSSWQTIGFRTEYDASSYLRFRTLSTYDPVRKLWNSTRVDVTWRPGSTLVTLGARYDGVRQVWGDVNLIVDGFTWGRLKTSALINWNGYLQEIQSQQFSFVYDLHCAEAVLDIIDNKVGFRSGQQINFFIRLKAFPSLSNFGFGNFGQPLGTGTGRRF
jgi:hypothetical protein